MEEKRGTQSGEGTGVIKEVTFRIERYIPGDGKPSWRDYVVPVMKGMTVLEGLIYIKEHADSSLAWRASCRMAVCGSCGVFINRFPMLSCHTQIMELGTDTVEIAPMPSFDNIRDLVPDLDIMFTKLQAVKPFIIRKRDPEEIDRPTAEFLQTEKEVLQYLQFSYCIKCGICLSACPTLATDRGYIGPQALTQAYRYSIDTRDDGLVSRRDAVDLLDGPFKCHFAGACSEACPKGVDPAMGVQLLRKALLLGLRRKGAAPVAGRVQGAQKKDGVPDPPKRTV